MKNNELEIIFKDNQGNNTMLWNNFIKNDEEHFGDVFITIEQPKLIRNIRV